MADDWLKKNNKKSKSLVGFIAGLATPQKDKWIMLVP
jgi:hypothetical protein